MMCCNYGLLWAPPPRGLRLKPSSIWIPLEGLRIYDLYESIVIS